MALLNCEFEFSYPSELIVQPLLYEGPKEEAVFGTLTRSVMIL